MPVTIKNNDQQPLYQREQYAKYGLGRWYWDYRDKIALCQVRDKDKDILDLGCGEGLTLERLTRKYPGRNIKGIDLLEENIEITIKHGLRAERGDACKLQFADQSFDFILFSEVIEHLDNPEIAIQEIHRVLKHGGRLVVIFPNDKIFRLARMVTFRFREASYDPGHVRQWRPAEMKEFLKRAGFKVVFARNIPFRVWFLSLHGIICGERKD